MSDVMKATQEAERVRTQKWTLDGGDMAADAIRAMAGAYRPMRDHIGELHSAIARLQGECDSKWVDPKLNDALADLFALLPTDWAGDEG